ncbi:MAG: hypothetical protein AAF288_03855 [Planctomycetota bacterium]
MPVLSRLVQFTEARQSVITHNIANLSTPNFRTIDVSVDGFRSQLGEAVDRRRRRVNPTRGELPLDDSRQVKFGEQSLSLRPAQIGRNVTFHDRNNRDLERLMQDLAENALAHNASVQLLRSRFDILRTAIRERVT